MNRFVNKKPMVVVRGAGDIATGVIQAFWRAGFDVVCTEIAQPTAIRRSVALSEACRLGVYTVEDVTAVRCETLADIKKQLQLNRVALVIDEQATWIDQLKPDAVVDAILAKRNIGTNREMAPVVVGLGPGFVAGDTVDYVIETMRGHQLGRMINKGEALPNTGVPGLVAGHAADRVIYAPASGVIHCVSMIAHELSKNDCLAIIERISGEQIPVLAPFTGILRGLIPDGFNVWKGMKIADIDARLDQVENCFTISDKARCIGANALIAVLSALKDRG